MSEANLESIRGRFADRLSGLLGEPVDQALIERAVSECEAVLRPSTPAAQFEDMGSTPDAVRVRVTFPAPPDPEAGP